MDMSENIPVCAQKDRVRGHAHVRLKIGGGLAVFIFHAESEPVRLVGFELRNRSALAVRAWWIVALPHHAIAAGKLRNFISGSQIKCSSIVASQRLSCDGR